MTEALDAVQKLRAARRRIVQIAAAWQAAGVDTEPLNLPLIEIQEAIAGLEAIDLPAEVGRRLAVLAKELGNHFNAIRVSGAGLETEDDPPKRLRWLDLMEQAADGCIRTLDRMHPLMSDRQEARPI
jgi:hypothetical protein